LSGEGRRAVRAALEAAAVRLRAAGVEEPLREAEILLAAVLGVPRVALHVDPPAADPAAEARFEALVAGRERRIPAAHLLGRAEFRSRAFRVTPAVLVPRPETEHLVEAALARIPAGAPAIAVDAGTGSGCIAVTLATERPLLRVIAVDRSAAALEVARGNARALGVEPRVLHLRGDFLEGIRGPVDLVVSNPPYVGIGESLPAEVMHEPAEALFAGPDGLDAYRALAPRAAAILRPGGAILVETPGDGVEAIAAILAAAGLEPLPPLQDLAGRPRVLEGRRP
jgi:release factor glutamine methyltransferase